MKKFFKSTIAMVAIAIVTSCSVEQPAPEKVLPQSNSISELETVQTSIIEETTSNPNLRAATCSSVTDACGTSTNKGNCVLFCRCKVPSLPYGLTSYADKKKIINTQTAAAGYIAIINTGGYYGHVAYVKSVSGSTIYLRESNWCGTYISERNGTKSGLSIVGYYRP